jgi:hypothetical protein
MTSTNTLASSVLFDQSAAKKLAAADIFPSDGGYRLNTTSIRATWIYFAGPGEAASFCMTHGVLKTSSPLPKGIKRGQARQCLRNAGLLALAHPKKFTYCEGWAQMPAHRGLTTYHAWCLDRTGNVVDPTWVHEKGAEYLGIPIKASALRTQILATKEWGFFHHGIYLPKGFSKNPKAFIESNFVDGSLEG